jgi:tRNA-2-methylthio-N6-dimethylallyladenosine synthase/ribosomal protein S12 methylthiotransferase
VVLINTCGFIRPAVEESLAAIMDAASAIAEATPRPLLAVAGCLVSRYGPELAAQIPEVDLWLTTHELPDWPAKIAQALRLGPAANPGRLLSGPPSYAYLKISEGCRHRCRFCAIPSIRGPLKSRPVKDLIPEARDILATGRRELILVAQDLTAYGRDLTPKQDLPSLLGGLLALPGLERLRLMYLYPAGLTKSLLGFMAQAGPTLLPYFDIPMQHAHPDILKAMGRPFAQDPRAVLDRVRAFFPRAAVRTSLIVGFPGERAAHFKSLMDFVAEARFQHLGVFAFQAEEGTPAAKLPRQVPMAERRKRREAVMARQAAISAAWLKEFEGQDLEVLVDAVSPEWPGLHLGRTWFQAPDIDGVTYVSGPGVAPGAMVKAEIVEAKTYDLVGLAG